MKNKKLRVCFVLPSLTAGGAERVLITLMNSLNRKQFSPVLVVVNESGGLKTLIDEDIAVYNLNSCVPFCLPRLYRELKSLKPDIVVSTMIHMNFMTLMLKPFMKKTRFIVREAIVPSFILSSHRLKAPFIKIAYRLLYPLADKIVSPAQAIIDELQKIIKIPDDSYALLYNPVDPQRILQSSKNRMKVGASRNKTVQFVAAGRLHHQKGFDRLIALLPKWDSSLRWHLSIWGEGGQRSLLEALISEKKLSDNVRLEGLSEKPWPHYAAADCFLMPSRWEGLPNVVLEALACGTPVIATRESGGIGEIASLAPEGAVTIVENMEGFLNAMQKVSPRPTEFFRPSLLPPEFRFEIVTSKFSDLLLDVSVSK